LPKTLTDPRVGVERNREGRLIQRTLAKRGLVGTGEGHDGHRRREERGGGDRAQRVSHRAHQTQPGSEEPARNQPRHSRGQGRPEPANQQATTDHREHGQRDQ
jgi:hypothetical protein